MFDKSAVELIRKAPIFGNLDLENLPKAFTDGYAEVISTRIAFYDGVKNTDELISLLNDAKRIASTYEAYVLLFSNKENHKSAAFVAASAYHLIFQINSAIYNDFNSDCFNDNYILPQISAALLYFISGYTSDASEMISKVKTQGVQEVEIRLLLALESLLTGNLNCIDTNHPVYPLENEASDKAASNILWAHIHKGVNILLKALCSKDRHFDMHYEMAKSVFIQVRELSQHDDTTTLNRNTEISYQAAYVGQYYLSSLLSIASNVVREIALINTPLPRGVNYSVWGNTLSSISINRPYLWPNHLDAIQKGYLDKGVSAVVSFPTGGGKSTLSELKIATSLARNEPVIFIVPTLALVDQVSKSLRKAFPSVTTKLSIEEFEIEDLEVEVLPDISVMTPESLLVKMSFTPESFDSVGLFVFDECHLMHSRSSEVADRRSIDAMLCLLRVIELSKNVDVLLMSAMIANNGEISNWLRQLINREVLALNINWKPTRQAKGCIVYDSQQVQILNQSISMAERTPGGKLTSNAKRDITAIPYSFFSLNQTWHSNNPVDYKLSKLSNHEVALGVNEYNHLTSNRNEVAASIAVNAIKSGLKTLIFAGDSKSCDSIVNEANSKLQQRLLLSDHESKLKALIDLEFGGEYSYYAPTSASLPHHGLLIREERHLHESLFSRDSGMDLIVATSTLAQGINLPAECVIIAGNTRFDPMENRQQELDAHELLNAAGRAGRAGKNATGVVLVIPGRVVSFDAQQNSITKYWREIKEVFSNEDQCLKLEDPLQLVLDKLQADDFFDNDDVTYFIQRLPVDGEGDCSRFMRSTLSAYKAQLNNNERWIDEKISTANQAFKTIRNIDKSEKNPGWYEQLASASGIEPILIRQLEQDFIKSRSILNTPIEHITWLMTWMAESYERLEKFVRVEALERAFKGDFKNLTNGDQSRYFESTVIRVLVLWMEGANLKEIELAIGTPERRLGKCKKAREFVIRVVPEIAYTAGILSRINHHIMIDSEENPENNKLKYLSQMTRLGFDRVAKLVLHNIVEDPASRVSTHIVYDNIRDQLYDLNEEASFSSLQFYIRTVYMRWVANGRT
ncbi:DEAD/DEAH box helicase [Alishewanella sp. d11]|uniref:DEAD/DEAH box helicase n=1 Tax=Alishewanella sp. d11 TaxID=3414030 RepID=UPI003BF89372